MLFVALRQLVRFVSWWGFIILPWGGAYAHDDPGQAVHPHTENSFVMGALGDSVTAGINSTGWGARVEHSWATGNHPDGQVNSHFKRLKDAFSDLNIERHNVARGGAKAAGLMSQVQDLSGLRLDYVSVLIGPNDACDWSGENSGRLLRFKNSVRDSVVALMDLNPEVKILLLPIPNMYALWEVGSEKSCQWMWDLTGICSPLLSSSRSDAERLAFQQRVDDANTKLQEVADEFSENIMFDISLGSFQFSSEHISGLDCFHPSGEGQDLLAKLAWDTGWYSGH